MNAQPDVSIDEEHEQRIQAEYVAMLVAYKRQDYVAARYHAGQMTALVEMRSPEQVARMEEAKGIAKV